MAFIEASLEELPVSANLGQSCLATKISTPGPSSFGWFRHSRRPGEVAGALPPSIAQLRRPGSHGERGWGKKEKGKRELREGKERREEESGEKKE